MNDVSSDFDQLSPVDSDILSAVERFLFTESRLLTADQQRKWLTTMVDPDIRYQVYVRELRLRRDAGSAKPDRAYIYDESFKELDIRVKQFETGTQWRSDPPERIRFFVSNVEAYETSEPDKILVFSNVLAVRNRRVYEESHFPYARRDVLRRGADGALRLVSREVDYDQRYVEGRNLMFFL